MSLVDKLTFESRGARGSSDSTYAFGMTTCCERVGVLDRELDDFYWQADTPSSVVNLLEDPPCPYCGAVRWGLHDIRHLDQVPDDWRWVCAQEPRPGSRRVRTLAEHARELLAFCERVAGPVPTFSSTLFAEAPGSLTKNGESPRGELLTASEFGPRFDRLLVSGYAWIRLTAYGIWRDALIVGVERPPEATGTPVGLTQVNYSAPALDSEGRRSWSFGHGVSE